MRNLGFQVELTPDQAYLTCARVGMRSMSLKTAMSTHLVLDLRDLAWYMGMVNFNSSTVKSFFSQHDHFEFSQMGVQQDEPVKAEALVSQGHWQVDPLRRELIRQHKEYRRNLHDMESSKRPSPNAG